jgi:uncharacterized protein YgiM (DUF1202 family)
MFRMTAALLLGLYAVFVIWGEPTPDDVAVARGETSPASAPVAVAAAPSTSPETQAPLARISDREALRMALAAGEKTAARTMPATAEVPEAEGAPDLWYVTGSRVNLRAGPSSSTAIVGGVSLGDRAEILSDPAEPWTRIRTESGIEAWIFSRFIAETPA